MRVQEKMSGVAVVCGSRDIMYVDTPQYKTDPVMQVLDLEKKLRKLKRKRKEAYSPNQNNGKN